MFNKNVKTPVWCGFSGGGGSLKVSLYKAFGLFESNKSVRSTLKNLFTCSPDNLVTHLPVNCCERDGLISHNALSPYRPIALLPKKVAFTMAEILLSLTIIGVVAAITLPSLTGNINERTWNTQRKALYSRLSQAVALMPSVRGYGSVIKDLGTSSDSYDDVYKSDNAAETFISNGLSKVLKMNNICDYNHLGDCGLPAQITVLGGASKVATNDLKRMTVIHYHASINGCGVDRPVDTTTAAFETLNGESVLLFYNPICEPDFGKDYANTVSNMCANFLYDLNGKKGPNTIGKDMGFMTLFYPTDSILVAPVPVSKDSPNNMTLNSANQYCRSQDNARVPNKEEVMSLGFNYKFMDAGFITSQSDSHWSATKYFDKQTSVSSEVWVLTEGDHGALYTNSPNNSYKVRCIKQFQ